MRSLRSRMLTVLATVVLCWTIALAALVLYFTHSQNSVWDEKLESIATRLLLSLPAGKALQASGESLKLRHAASPDSAQLVFQVWLDRSRMVASTPGSPATALRPDFVEGPATSVIDGVRWRVYSVSDSTGRIHVQVGNVHSLVAGEMQKRAIVALALNTLLLMLVGGLMWFAVHRSLRPVVAVGAALRGRRSFDLTPLSAQALPSELQPLVAAFNHVLAQLSGAVEGERRFIADAAHELRTPLSALQAQAQVAMHAQTAAEKDAAVAKLVVVVERTVRLSEQLLDLARLNAGANAPEHTSADLGELILHVMREFEIDAQKQARAITLAIEPAPIQCNVDEIGILLRNLVDNALRHTPADARIRIGCGHDAGPGGPFVYLEVADDGPGVPEAEREAIFRRFYRAAGTDARGSGIGMSLVAGIAQLHHARIQTSEGLEGRGFGIRILFPAAESASLPGPPDRQNR